MPLFIIGVQGVLGLLFVGIGSMTVAGMSMFVENFRHFGYPQRFRTAIGSLEVLGGIGLLVGIWLTWLTALASTGLTLVMLGAVLTHLRVKDPFQRMVLPIVLGVLSIVVAVTTWPAFLHLFARP